MSIIVPKEELFKMYKEELKWVDYWSTYQEGDGDCDDDDEEFIALKEYEFSMMRAHRLGELIEMMLDKNANSVILH